MRDLVYMNEEGSLEIWRQDLDAWWVTLTSVTIGFNPSSGDQYLSLPFYFMTKFYTSPEQNGREFLGEL